MNVAPMLSAHALSAHANQQKIPGTLEARRRVEARLQKLGQRIFDVSFTCVLRGAPDGLARAFETALQDLPGEAAGGEAFPGEPVRVHPDDQGLLDVHLQRVMEGQRDLCVLRIEHGRDGARWVSSLLRPVLEGQQVGVVYGLIQDLSDGVDDNRGPAAQTARVLRFSSLSP